MSLQFNLRHRPNFFVKQRKLRFFLQVNLAKMVKSHAVWKSFLDLSDRPTYMKNIFITIISILNYKFVSLHWFFVYLNLLL